MYQYYKNYFNYVYSDAVVINRNDQQQFFKTIAFHFWKTVNNTRACKLSKSWQEYITDTKLWTTNSSGKSCSLCCFRTIVNVSRDNSVNLQPPFCRSSITKSVSYKGITDNLLENKYESPQYYQKAEILTKNWSIVWKLIGEHLDAASLAIKPKKSLEVTINPVKSLNTEMYNFQVDSDKHHFVKHLAQSISIDVAMSVPKFGNTMNLDLNPASIDEWSNYWDGVLKTTSLSANRRELFRQLLFKFISDRKSLMLNYLEGALQETCRELCLLPLNFKLIGEKVYDLAHPLLSTIIVLSSYNPATASFYTYISPTTCLKTDKFQVYLLYQQYMYRNTDCNFIINKIEEFQPIFEAMMETSEILSKFVPFQLMLVSLCAMVKVFQVDLTRSASHDDIHYKSYYVTGRQNEATEVYLPVILERLSSHLEFIFQQFGLINEYERLWNALRLVFPKLK